MEEQNNSIDRNIIVRGSMSNYINNNFSNPDEINEAEGEVNILVDALLNGKISPSELGGINAMRGFFYQYYVAIYYLIKSIYNESKFSYLIYELGDDITLISDKVIKFVQVKTEKEDIRLHSITRKKLTDREKKLDSWIDKLFLNLASIKEKLDGLGYTEEKLNNIFDEYEIEFELSTNLSYSSVENVAQYSDKDKSGKDNTYLVQKLEQAINGINFNSECPKQLEWCLDRFTIEHMGVTDILWRAIVTEIQKAQITEDLEIANRIINKLLLYIIERTHNDNIVDSNVREKYVFTKEIVVGLVDYFKNQAINELNDERKNLNFKEIFDRYFIEIQEEIDLNWKSKMQELFSSSLLWLQSLIHEKQEEDPYIYQRLINRIFFLEGYGTTVFDINSLLRDGYLKSTIRSVIFYMAFYSSRSIYDNQNTKFFIKEGITEYDEKNIIAIYNARGREPIDICIEKVIRKSKECLVVSDISSEINCFILNYKKMQIKENSLSKILETKAKITRNRSVPKIKDKYDNISFFDSSNLETCRDTLLGFAEQAVAIDMETTRAVIDFLFNNNEESDSNEI